MAVATADHLRHLLTLERGPCLSIYQPTHRRPPDNQQDPIRFRNLIREAEPSLGARLSSRACRDLLDPFHALAQDEGFWRDTRDGLAVFGAPDFFRVVQLHRRMPQRAVVADSFHLKPLLRHLQSAERYQVLGVTRQSVRLFEGQRDTLDAMEPAAAVPRLPSDVSGAESGEPHLTVASYGGADGPAMHHGHGSRKDEVAEQTERFFRAVDRAVLEHHSRPAGLPLILAALPEHQAAFRRVSHNPYLVSDGVVANPEALAAEALGARAWQIYEPRLDARMDGAVELFRSVQPDGLGIDDLDAIARASLAGRVGTLLIDGDRRVPGRVVGAEGHVDYAGEDAPGVDDVLDDLGEHVLRRGGNLLVLPASRMPTGTGAAAVLRY